MHPLFIVLDGPDATGTTTHVELLAERLRGAGHDVLLTMEPTDGPIGKRIREELKKGKMDPLELQKLFTEDRAWHVQNVIEPALKAGKTVICDRYWHSTIVYAEAQGLPTDELQKMNDCFVQPDIVIFTLPPVEVSLARIRQRPEREFFERGDLQRKIHDGYERMAEEDPAISVIDTSGNKEDVHEQIWKAVMSC